MSAGERLLALPTIYDGGSRTMAACFGGFADEARLDAAVNCYGPDGLIDGKASQRSLPSRREPAGNAGK